MRMRSRFDIHFFGGQLRTVRHGADQWGLQVRMEWRAPWVRHSSFWVEGRAMNFQESWVVRRNRESRGVRRHCLKLGDEQCRTCIAKVMIVKVGYARRLLIESKV